MMECHPRYDRESSGCCGHIKLGTPTCSILSTDFPVPIPLWPRWLHFLSFHTCEILLCPLKNKFFCRLKQHMTCLMHFVCPAPFWMLSLQELSLRFLSLRFLAWLGGVTHDRHRILLESLQRWSHVGIITLIVQRWETDHFYPDAFSLQYTGALSKTKFNRNQSNGKNLCPPRSHAPRTLGGWSWRGPSCHCLERICLSPKDRNARARRLWRPPPIPEDICPRISKASHFHEPVNSFSSPKLSELLSVTTKSVLNEVLFHVQIIPDQEGLVRWGLWGWGAQHGLVLPFRALPRWWYSPVLCVTVPSSQVPVPCPAMYAKWASLAPFCSGVPKAISYEVAELVLGVSSETDPRLPFLLPLKPVPWTHTSIIPSGSSPGSLGGNWKIMNQFIFLRN